MATTNLISKSIGDILMETGNGSPDHTSPKGSTYVDQDSGIMYTNKDGGVDWEEHNNITYANMWLTGNTTNTTITVAGTWYSLRPLSWSGGTMHGIVYSGATNVLVADRPGTYLVTCNANLGIVSATNSKYDVGISKNFISPQFNYYQGCSTDATEDNPNINVIGFYDLVSVDTIELGVRNTSSTNNALLQDASITIFKIGN